jgi:hypothetical protein
MRHRNAIPRNEREAEARERALAALALMRRKRVSRGAAAKAEGTTPATMLRYVGSALRRDGPRGRYRASKFDRIPRTIEIPTRTGPQVTTVRDSRVASQIGEYLNAVKSYARRGGDRTALRRFEGRTFRVSGVVYPFLTDPGLLDRLADAGMLEIESLYRASMSTT